LKQIVSGRLKEQLKKLSPKSAREAQLFFYMAQKLLSKSAKAFLEELKKGL